VNCLFWNTGGSDLTDALVKIVQTHAVDLLVLAESEEIAVGPFLKAVNDKEGTNFRFHNAVGQERLRVFSSLPAKSVSKKFDTGGVSIRHVRPPVNDDFILVAVHLPSKLRWQEREQQDICPRIRNYIETVETQIGHQRTIVVGDLNMNPFEHGVVSSEGFHAVMTRRDAAKKSRTVMGEQRHFFYNPMWKHFGDCTDNTPGTCYFPRSTPLSYYWNMFDQVLVRPDLLNAFPDDGLSILTKTGESQLVDKNGRPDSKLSSDHLPILFRLDLPIVGASHNAN
jgi:endonuclease/exonuclease/phosphatase family metal-dependent hydrolase